LNAIWSNSDEWIKFFGFFPENERFSDLRFLASLGIKNDKFLKTDSGRERPAKNGTSMSKYAPEANLPLKVHFWAFGWF